MRALKTVAKNTGRSGNYSHKLSISCEKYGMISNYIDSQFTKVDKSHCEMLLENNAEL